MYLMVRACLHVRKKNEKGVQHEAIGCLRELVKKGAANRYYSQTRKIVAAGRIDRRGRKRDDEASGRAKGDPMNNNATR